MSVEQLKKDRVESSQSLVSRTVNFNRTGHPFSWTGWDIQLTLSNDLMSYFEFSNNPSLLLIIFKILRNVWNLIKIVCWMLINGCLEHSNWCEWLVIRLCHMLGRVFRLDNDGWMSQPCLPPSSAGGGTGQGWGWYCSLAGCCCAWSAIWVMKTRTGNLIKFHVSSVDMKAPGSDTETRLSPTVRSVQT